MQKRLAAVYIFIIMISFEACVPQCKIPRCKVMMDHTHMQTAESVSDKSTKQVKSKVVAGLPWYKTLFKKKYRTEEGEKYRKIEGERYTGKNKDEYYIMKK